LIPIVGGLLIMMGQQDRSEALFYYFRLEDQVPTTHLLRLIEDGSTLTLPAEGHGGNGTLWDNKTGIGYRLNLEHLTAYEIPTSPHRPNPKAPAPAAKWPEDAVEGIPCKVVPVYVESAPGTPYAKSTTPGTACHSGELDLELRSDFVVETGPGTTEHHVKELRNIKVNADLDPALFDPHNYVIDGPGN
jgi:hypothetical protein